MADKAPVHYVCGFRISTDASQVLLIRKKKPVWQHGLLNGIGGKIEPGESVDYAMSREFHEEADKEIAPSDWEQTIRLCGKWGSVYFFRSFGNFEGVRSTGAEKVETIRMHKLRGHRIISNLLWIIPLQLEDFRWPLKFEEKEKLSGR